MARLSELAELTAMPPQSKQIDLHQGGLKRRPSDLKQGFTAAYEISVIAESTERRLMSHFRMASWSPRMVWLPANALLILPSILT